MHSRLEPLSFTYTPGVLRTGHTLLLGGVSVFAGWIWLGSAGAALVCLWVYVQRCNETSKGRTRQVYVEPHALRSAWLGQLRICFSTSPFRRQEIYRDELSASQWSAVRRWLKRVPRHRDQ